MTTTMTMKKTMMKMIMRRRRRRRRKMVRPCSPLFGKPLWACPPPAGPP